MQKFNPLTLVMKQEMYSVFRIQTIARMFAWLMPAILAGAAHAAIPAYVFAPEDNALESNADDQLKLVVVRLPDNIENYFAYVKNPNVDIIPQAFYALQEIPDYLAIQAINNAFDTWNGARWGDFSFHSGIFPSDIYPTHPNNDFDIKPNRLALDGFNLITFATEDNFSDDTIAATNTETYFLRDFDANEYIRGIMEVEVDDVAQFTYITEIELDQNQLRDYDGDGVLDIFLWKDKWEAGEIVDCDITFNPDSLEYLRVWPDDLSDVSDNEQSDVVGSLDLQTIMTMILGRPLGLEIANIRDSTMFPYIEGEEEVFPTNPYLKRKLSFDDEVGFGIIHGQDFPAYLASVTGDVLEGQFVSSALSGTAGDDAVVADIDDTLDEVVAGASVYLMVRPEVLTRSDILSGGAQSFVNTDEIHPDNVEALPVIGNPAQGVYRKICEVMSGQFLRIPAASADPEEFLYPLPEFDFIEIDVPPGSSGGLDDEVFEILNLGQLNGTYYIPGIPATDDFGTTISYALYLEAPEETDIITEERGVFLDFETFTSEFYGGNGAQIRIGDGTTAENNSSQDQEFENTYITAEVTQEGRLSAAINDGPSLLSGFRTGPSSFFEVISPNGRYSNRLTNIGANVEGRFIDDFNDLATAKWLRPDDFSVTTRWQITTRGGLVGVPAGILVAHTLTNETNTTRTLSFRQVLDTRLFGKENPIYRVNSEAFVRANSAAYAAYGTSTTVVTRSITLQNDFIPSELTFATSVNNPAFTGFVTIKEGSFIVPTYVTIGTLGELDKIAQGTPLLGLNKAQLDTGVALRWENITLKPNSSVPLRFIVGFRPPGKLIDTWVNLDEGTDLDTAITLLEDDPEVDDPGQIELLTFRPGERQDGVNIVTNTATGGGDDADGTSNVIPLSGPGTPASFTLEGGAFPESDYVTADGVLGDIDNDGDLDIITAGYGGGSDPVSSRINRIYINRQRSNADGTLTYFFEDSTFGDDGVPNSNDDRWLDSSGNPNALTEVSLDILLEDFDGDGDLDVFVTNRSPQDENVPNRLYMNLGNPAAGDFTNIGRFQDISELVLPGLLNLGWGTDLGTGYPSRAVAGDIDSDGDVDLIISQEIPFNDYDGVYLPSEAFVDNDPQPDDTIPFPGDNRVRATDGDEFSGTLLYAERVLINQINTPNYSTYDRGFYFRDETLGADDRSGTITSLEIQRNPGATFTQSLVSWDPAELDRMPPIFPSLTILPQDGGLDTNDSPMGAGASEPRLGNLFGDNSLDLMSVRRYEDVYVSGIRLGAITTEDVDDPPRFLPVDGNNQFGLAGGFHGTESAYFRNLDLFSVDLFADAGPNYASRPLVDVSDGVADGYFQCMNYNGDYQTWTGGSIFDLGTIATGPGLFVIEMAGLGPEIAEDGAGNPIIGITPDIVIERDVHPNGSVVPFHDALPLFIGMPQGARNDYEPDNGAEEQNILDDHNGRGAFAGLIGDWEYTGAPKPFLAGHRTSVDEEEGNQPLHFTNEGTGVAHFSPPGVSRSQLGVIGGIAMPYYPHANPNFTGTGPGITGNEPYNGITAVDMNTWAIVDNPLPEGETLRMLAEDFDLDGDIDVLMVNSTTIGISTPEGGGFTVSGDPAPNQIYLNDGFGEFTANSVMLQPNSQKVSLSADMGDIDNDGDQDLVIFNALSSNELYISQVFSSAPNLFDSNDATLFFESNINTLPAIIGRSVAPPFNDGDSFMTGVTIRTTIGDFNMDGRPDILNANGGQYTEEGDTLIVLQNVGRKKNIDADQFFVPAGSDFPGPRVSLYAHNFNQEMEPEIFKGVLGSPGFITDSAVSDIDMDGDNDVIIVELVPTGLSNNSSTPQVWINVDSEEQFLNTAPDSDSIGDGIFDASTGVPDLVIPGAPNPSAFPQKKQSRRVIMADLVNGDGVPDMLLINGRANGGNPNVLLSNNGSGIFSDVTEDLLPMNYDESGSLGPEDYIYDNSFDAAVADFDNDGDRDIIVVNRNNEYSPDGIRFIEFDEENGVFVDLPVGDAPGARLPSLAFRTPHSIGVLDADLIGEVTEDANYNGVLDEGEVEFILADGVISHEDRPNETEDINGNGILDYEYEDLNGNGELDPGEDGLINRNGKLDTQDLNGDGLFNYTEDIGIYGLGGVFIGAGNGELDQLDYNNDGYYTYRQEGVWEGSLDVYISYENDINVMLINDPTNIRAGTFTDETTIRFPDGLVDSPSKGVAIGNLNAIVNRTMDNGQNTGPRGYRFTSPSDPEGYLDLELRPGNGEEIVYARFVGGNTNHVDAFLWGTRRRPDGTILRGVFQNINDEVPVARGVRNFNEVTELGDDALSRTGFATDVDLFDYDLDGDLDMHIACAGNTNLVASVGGVNFMFTNRFMGRNDNAQVYRNTTPDQARSPVVLNVVPGGAGPGDEVEVKVQGGSFLPGVNFGFGRGVQVQEVQYLSVNEAKVKLKISESAVIGPRAVYSRNSTGAGSLTKDGMFYVTEMLDNPIPPTDSGIQEPEWMSSAQ